MGTSSGWSDRNNDGGWSDKSRNIDIIGLEGKASPDSSQDYLAIYDASMGINKKVLVGNLPSALGSGISTVRENAVNVVTNANVLDFKDTNVEDLTGGIAGIYLDIPLICQGRLTLETGVPVSTTDQTAKTTLYWTPYLGNQVSLYDGTRWKKYAFSELSIAVPATTSTMYDVFLYDNAGTLTLELTSWTNDTTRATALVLQNGIYVKSGATTRRYLGSFRTTTVSGQTEDSMAHRFVDNAYNRVMRKLKVIETANSWSSSGLRYFNNSSLNRLELVVGLQEEIIIITAVLNALTTLNQEGAISIGKDSTTAAHDLSTREGFTAASTHNNLCAYHAHLIDVTAIGFHFYAALENAASGTVTFYGDNAAAIIQSGIIGMRRM